MSFVVPKQRKPLVYIEPETNYYSRYIGRQCFGGFVSHRSLDRYEIELFRTNPETFISPDDLDPFTRKAA